MTLVLPSAIKASIKVLPKFPVPPAMATTDMVVDGSSSSESRLGNGEVGNRDICDVEKSST
jgi:hypothetical protein